MTPTDPAALKPRLSLQAAKVVEAAALYVYERNQDTSIWPLAEYANLAIAVAELHKTAKLAKAAGVA